VEVDTVEVKVDGASSLKAGNEERRAEAEVEPETRHVIGTGEAMEGAPGDDVDFDDNHHTATGSDRVNVDDGSSYTGADAAPYAGVGAYADANASANANASSNANAYTDAGASAGAAADANANANAYVDAGAYVDPKASAHTDPVQ
jgi:hypothetical protein